VKISKLVSIGIGILIATFIGCGSNNSDNDSIKTIPPTPVNKQLKTPPKP